MIFITIQTLALIFLNVHYNTKKKKAREQLSAMEDSVKCVNLEELEGKSSRHIAFELEEKEKEELGKRNAIMKFIDGNILQGTEKRLTMIGHEEMSDENIRKMREAYRHPFDKIPKGFFSNTTKTRGHTFK